MISPAGVPFRACSTGSHQAAGSMISLHNKLRLALERLPLPVGHVISHVPYSLRLHYGYVYRRRLQEMAKFANYTLEEKQEFVFDRVKRAAQHAYTSVPFYRRLYKGFEFDPQGLKTFADLRHIPVVTKEMLREVELEQRSFRSSNRSKVNTGGSSGSPLAFYILPSSIGHEWAHMHHIWAKLGYRQTDLKLSFGGRNLC